MGTPRCLLPHSPFADSGSKCSCPGLTLGSPGVGSSGDGSSSSAVQSGASCFPSLDRAPTKPGHSPCLSLPNREPGRAPRHSTPCRPVPPGGADWPSLRLRAELLGAEPAPQAAAAVSGPSPLGHLPAHLLPPRLAAGCCRAQPATQAGLWEAPLLPLPETRHSSLPTQPVPGGG